REGLVGVTEQPQTLCVHAAQSGVVNVAETGRAELRQMYGAFQSRSRVRRHLAQIPTVQTRDGREQVSNGIGQGVLKSYRGRREALRYLGLSAVVSAPVQPCMEGMQEKQLRQHIVKILCELQPAFDGRAGWGIPFREHERQAEARLQLQFETCS